MASALDGTSGGNFSGHEGEDPGLPPDVLVFEFIEVLLDEGDVFDGFHEAPHSKLLVALLFMALANGFVLLLSDPEEGFAGAHAFIVLGEQ